MDLIPGPGDYIERYCIEGYLTGMLKISANERTKDGTPTNIRFLLVTPQMM